jgi:acetaldehyde dehydrogenase (acetylating)
MSEKKLKVAIIGTGNIGTDLLVKVLKSSHLECTAFIGRNRQSKGMMKAQSLGVHVSDRGISEIIDNPDCCDLVFDATSANSHIVHWEVLKSLGKIVIDMTPSNIGQMFVPAINNLEFLDQEHVNINMISCGGQVSIPMAYAIKETQKDVKYIEVVSSIASMSAGPGTRANIDEYINTTQKALTLFSGCNNTKTILNLNPAVPCIHMQTTIFAEVDNPDIEALSKMVEKIVVKIQKYVPGYKLVVKPTYENKRIIITVKVSGRGDFLPEYAGNLDVINCAAIAAAEEIAKKFDKIKSSVEYRLNYNE